MTDLNWENQPHPFSSAAQGYITLHYSDIAQIAAALGVSPASLAGGIAREMTRDRAFGAQELRDTALTFALSRGDAYLESAYQSDLQIIQANPNAFDGKNFITSGLNPLIID